MSRTLPKEVSEALEQFKAATREHDGVPAAGAALESAILSALSAARGCGARILASRPAPRPEEDR